MPESMWRAEAVKVIQRTVADNPGVTGAELDRLISAAYPFGERKHHPYKVWLAAARDERDRRRARTDWAGGGGLRR